MKDELRLIHLRLTHPLRQIHLDSQTLVRIVDLQGNDLKPLKLCLLSLCKRFTRRGFGPERWPHVSLLNCFDGDSIRWRWGSLREAVLFLILILCLHVRLPESLSQGFHLQTLMRELCTFFERGIRWCGPKERTPWRLWGHWQLVRRLLNPRWDLRIRAGQGIHDSHLLLNNFLDLLLGKQALSNLRFGEVFWWNEGQRGFLLHLLIPIFNSHRITKPRDGLIVGLHRMWPFDTSINQLYNSSQVTFHLKHICYLDACSPSSIGNCSMGSSQGPFLLGFLSPPLSSSTFLSGPRIRPPLPSRPPPGLVLRREVFRRECFPAKLIGASGGWSSLRGIVGRRPPGWQTSQPNVLFFDWNLMPLSPLSGWRKKEVFWPELRPWAKMAPHAFNSKTSSLVLRTSQVIQAICNKCGCSMAGVEAHRGHKITRMEFKV